MKIYIPSNRAHRSLMKTPNLSWEKIAEHYRPSADIKDWEKLHIPEQWREGRSAVELASSWETAKPGLPSKIAALFYGAAELLAAIPQHETPLPGRGKPSQSDVLAFVRIKNGVCAVAVEGKKDEEFGKPVGKWLPCASADKHKNKHKRLKHIADQLGLSCPPPGHIRYQLLHRTAAAVIEAKRFNTDCAAMIVQSFSPEHAWFEDFQKLLNLFGIDPVKRDKIYETEVPGMTLYFGWTSP